MPRIIAALIRHGDYQQLADTPSAHQAYPLTETGLKQAAALAPALTDISHQFNCQINPTIASSRLLRAWQTAFTMTTRLTISHLAIQEHNELAERCVGSVANLSEQQIRQIVSQDPRFDELPENWKSDSHFCLPFQGSESLLTAGLRVANFIKHESQTLQQDSKCNQLKIFVGHGAAFRHAAYHLGILEFEQIAQLSMFHCQPVFIEHHPDKGWQQVAGEWKIRDKRSQFKD